MPSNLHIDLSKRALRYFSARISEVRQGRREVQVASQYVVDAMAIGNLQHRFAKHYKLPWIVLPSQGKLAISDINQYFIDEDIRTEQLLIAEVKVSRADFLKTFKSNGNVHDNRFKSVGNLHWIVTPKGMIDPNEVPSFWGLLEVAGPGLREVVTPVWQKVSSSELYRISFQALYGYRLIYESENVMDINLLNRLEDLILHDKSNKFLKSLRYIRKGKSIHELIESV